MPGGGVALATGMPTVVHVAPPSAERSTMIVVQQYFFFGLKLVSDVDTAPLGSTCGSRYVAPCGRCPCVGSGCGADHGVCLPFGSAVAYDRYGTGVARWKFTHMA